MTGRGAAAMALCCAALCLLASVGARAEDQPWQKVATTEQRLARLDQVFTPGLFDRTLQKLIALPPDGTPTDLELPHAGAGKDGKPFPALKAAFKGGFVWLDLNGDGRQDAQEVVQARAGAELGPFAFLAHYEDGTEGVYWFRLRYSGDNRFVLVRSCARVAKIGRETLTFFDENGNGRYDDLNADALLIQGQPVTFLSRQVYLGGKLHELLVHPAAQTIEVRPLPEEPTGTVDVFRMFEYPSSSSQLQIHTVIIAGRNGAFAFDKRRTTMEVPVGAYDIVFGLLQRNKELVYVKRGERTSFNVEAGKAATPAWGGPIQGVFPLEGDGVKITVGPPRFIGKASEEYVPADWDIPVRAHLSFIWRDRNFNDAERFDATGVLRMPVKDDGTLEPVTFEKLATSKHGYRVRVEYKSGVLGTVWLEDRVGFLARRK